MSEYKRRSSGGLSSMGEPTDEPRTYAPGKRTRTMSLPAGNNAPVQLARDPAISTDPATVDATARWFDEAVRPDLHCAPVQRKTSDAVLGAPTVAIPTRAGQALEPSVQAGMEQAFRANFSAVRVHEGEHVPAVGALAYTQGADIHFAPGQYDPSSTRGRELLGHELTHVVQQAEGRVGAPTQAKGVTINADAALETEADDLGARAARGEQVRAGAPVAAAPATGTSIQRYAFINQQQIRTTEASFTAAQAAFAGDTVVRDYQSLDEFQRHATGGTDYLGNLPDGTWLRFHPTGINLLGENHTLVSLDQVVPVINTRSFICERLSNDALAPGSHVGAAYETENAGEFQRFGIAQQSDRQQFGAESLYPKIGYAMSLALPYLTSVQASVGLKAPNYVGQPVQRYFKIGWGHSEDNLADITARRAAGQPVQPAAAALATVHTAVAPLLGPFLTGLTVDGYLGNALDVQPNKAALVPALAQFAQAMIEAMTERALTDSTSRLTPQERTRFGAGGGATNSEREQMFSRWRNNNFEDSVRDATARGVRYAGMGRAHLDHLRSLGLSAAQHPYDMADVDLNRFRTETAELRARAI